MACVTIRCRKPFRICRLSSISTSHGFSPYGTSLFWIIPSAYQHWEVIKRSTSMDLQVHLAFDTGLPPVTSSIIHLGSFLKLSCSPPAGSQTVDSERPSDMMIKCGYRIRYPAKQRRYRRVKWIYLGKVYLKKCYINPKRASWHGESAR